MYIALTSFFLTIIMFDIYSPTKVLENDIL
jgi:hypothetical protein